MTKLSDFESQRPTGYVPSATPEPAPAAKLPVGQSSSKIRKPQSINETPQRIMTTQECVEYADQGTVLLLRHRIQELNESIETVRAEGNTMQEWEALHMIIHELERIIVNIPGYTDPARGKPDMSSVK